MSKKNIILPVLLVALLAFTGCIERSWEVSSKSTIPIEFEESRAELKSRISAISTAEVIQISTSNHKSNDEPETNSININVINPAEFPANTESFELLSDKIKEEVKRSVTNTEEFNSIKIDFREESTTQNGYDKTRSYKREIQF